MKLMKYKLLAIMLIVSSLSFYGCDDMLDMPTESVITSSSYWKNENDANSGLNGAYNLLRACFDGGYVSNYFIWGDYRTGFYGDNINNAYAVVGNVWDNQLDPSTRGTDWGKLYKCINSCNLILSHVPQISFRDESDKNNVLGQAYFIRALCYWFIARIWGDAPLMTQGIESYDVSVIFPSRESKDKVFDLIESDLDEAASRIGSGNGINKSNLSTVYLLQADVFLWQYKVNSKGDEYLSKAAKAIENFESVNSATLSESYESIFRNDSNSEIIFSFPYIQGEDENGPSGFLNLVNTVKEEYRNNPVPISGDTQWVIITDSQREFLYEDANDTRAIVNMAIYNAPTGETYKWINKYLGTWKDGTRYNDSDLIMYRYADAILLKAEILNEQGNQSGSISEINKIAERAYGNDNYYDGTYDKTQVDEIITNERMKEFPSEGKLWFDLIRLGKAFEKIPTLSGKENVKGILLWPVSAGTINNNPNITQTEGY